MRTSTMYVRSSVRKGALLIFQATDDISKDIYPYPNAVLFWASVKRRTFLEKS